MSQNDTVRRLAIGVMSWNIPIIPLPVVPAQDPQKYPKQKPDGSIDFEPDGFTPKPAFTGKNPSYFDEKGEPQPIGWKAFKKRRPSVDQMRLWWSNPKTNGIGVFIQDGRWRLVDIDVSRFGSAEDTESFVSLYLDQYPQIKGAYRERTRSGGFHIAVKFPVDPDFTNVKFGSDGVQIGELKKDFIVIAPTPDYYCEAENNFSFVEVESPESIGLFSTAKKDEEVIDRPAAVFNAYGVSLREFSNGIVQKALGGVCSHYKTDGTGDRSESLTAAANELYGNENRLALYGIPVDESAEALVYAAGTAIGLDDKKIERIIKTVNPHSCESSFYKLGGDVDFWKRLRHIDREKYESNCPINIKREVEAVIKEYTGIKSAAKIETEKNEQGLKLDTFEQMRKEIAEALLLEDPKHRTFRLMQISKHYSAPLPFVHSIVDEVTERKSTKTSFDIRELAAMKPKGAKFIIPSVLPRVGLMHLGGFAKDGKTTFVHSLVAALLKGTSFLNEPIQKQKRVLFIELEESADRIRERLEMSDVLHDPQILLANNLLIKTNWKIDDLDRLQVWVREFKPDVIVFDSLRALARKLGVSENAQEFGSPLYSIQAFLNQEGISGLMIHHTIKNTEARGLLKLAGTSAIAGACDNVCLIERVSTNPEDSQRRLIFQGRDINRNLVVDYAETGEETNSCYWKVVQERGIEAGDRELKDRILIAVQRNIAGHPNGITATEVNQILERKEDAKGIYRPLKALVDGGLLVYRNDPKSPKLRRYFTPETVVAYDAAIESSESTALSNSHLTPSTSKSSQSTVTQHTQTLVDTGSGKLHGSYMEVVTEQIEVTSPNVDVTADQADATAMLLPCNYTEPYTASDTAPCADFSVPVTGVGSEEKNVTTDVDALSVLSADVTPDRAALDAYLAEAEQNASQPQPEPEQADTAIATVNDVDSPELEQSGDVQACRVHLTHCKTAAARERIIKLYTKEAVNKAFATLDKRTQDRLKTLKPKK